MLGPDIQWRRGCRDVNAYLGRHRLDDIRRLDLRFVAELGHGSSPG
jgi:hypothetical protein